MGVTAEGILKGCQGLFTPVSFGYPLSVFNKKNLISKESRAGKNTNKPQKRPVSGADFVSPITDEHLLHVATFQ